MHRTFWLLSALVVAISVALIAGSFCLSGWLHDVLFNTGFLILGALFTALIIDRLVQWNEESRWDDAREVAWKRLRAVATSLVQGIAVYYPDPGLTLNSPSQVDETQRKINISRAYHSLYSSPEWIRHVQVEVIPAFQARFLFDQESPSLEVYQLVEMTQRMEACMHEFDQCLRLFSQFLSPTQLYRSLDLLEVIRAELPLVRVVMNETIHGGLQSSQPRPELAPILIFSMSIVEEVNRKYPPSHVG